MGERAGGDPGRRTSSRHDRTSAVAAIDCGTNSTRLLVADESGRELVRLMRITRLGQGVDRQNELAPEAIARTVGVLHEFRRSMDRFGVDRVRMVATSAVRDAENGAAFIEAAQAAVGVDPEVLSGTEEGDLAYSGASADLLPFEGDTLVVDIGGGSTEITLGRGGSVSSVSLQLGCVRLTERFLKGDPPTAEEVAADARGDTRCARARGRAAAGADRPRLRRVAWWDWPGRSRPWPRSHWVSPSTTWSSCIMSMLTLERDRGDVRRAGVPLAPASARGLVGMVPGREDVILGGALVLDVVAARYDCPEVIVSEKDILDGIVLSIL